MSPNARAHARCSGFASSPHSIELPVLSLPLVCAGLGFMMATSLVQNGCRVLIASRKAAQLEKAADELNALAGDAGGSCEWIAADLASKAGCDKLVAAVKEKCEDGLHIVSGLLGGSTLPLTGRASATRPPNPRGALADAVALAPQLVNNSGVSWGAKFESFPEEKGWDTVLATNVKSIFYLSSGLAPLLEKNGTPQDPGRIVNISSVAGLDPKAEGTGLAPPGAGLWSYNTSKVGVAQASRVPNTSHR